MKTILKIAVLAVLIFVLVFGGSSRCSELVAQVDHLVSTAQMAQELGANIGWEPYDTNDIKVWLEFSLHGQLARFNQCDLKVVSDGRNLVTALLLPTKLTSDRGVFSFTVSRDFVEKSSFTLFADDYSECYIFAAKDFVKSPHTFTFIGVPRTMSTNTFQDIGGLKRELTVDVLRVTAGSFSGPQEKFSVYANWPWPPKLGVEYSITAGYGQHGHVVILKYHEIK